MITPFGLRHIGLMRELQRACVELDPKSALLGELPRPLQAALRGYFLKSNGGTFTYVARAFDHPNYLCGFAQARGEQSGRVWRVVRMAPYLDYSEDVATIWYRLLLHSCIAAGERQVQRLFACLREGSAAEDVFRQASFVVYCHERVFWRPPRPTDGETWPRRTDGETESDEAAGQLSPRIQPVQSDDCSDVWHLWYKATPRPVLQTEELDNSRSGPLLFDALGSDAGQAHVLRSRGGETLGCLHVLSRPRGAWLRLLLDPNARDCAAEMLGHGLALLADHSQPIYCAVREYEGGMQAVLQERGFVPADTYSLLVKHTTVRVREPRRRLVPAFEKRVEITPTVSRSETGDH
ncbi:MAG: hypothetical protein AMJ93_06080 [Anaerolineae bacterium SM23_84]|nr:MAG: hypothetical protein AMJ93_06080 [Anaerolineae bacterium SM23_84]